MKKLLPNESNGVVAIALAAVMLSGLALGMSCGSPAATPSPTPTPTPGNGSPPPATTVEIADFAFVPAVIAVPVGATVTWSNSDTVIHTVNSRDGRFDSPNLSRGDTFSYTFTEAGTFDYYCAVHFYMEGTVNVE